MWPCYTLLSCRRVRSSMSQRLQDSASGLTVRVSPKRGCRLKGALSNYCRETLTLSSSIVLALYSRPVEQIIASVSFLPLPYAKFVQLPTTELCNPSYILHHDSTYRASLRRFVHLMDLLGHGHDRFTHSKGTPLARYGMRDRQQPQPCRLFR